MEFFVIFLVYLLVFFITTLFMIFIHKKKNIKHLKYTIFWIAIMLVICLKTISEMNIFDCEQIKRFIALLSLIINSYAYIHLLGIYRFEIGKHDNYVHIVYGLQTLLWVIVSYFIIKNNYPMSFYNSILIIGVAIYSIKYKRQWFFISCIFLSIFFFLLGIYLFNDITTLDYIWIFPALASITAIIGTIKNGDNNHW